MRKLAVAFVLTVTTGIAFAQSAQDAIVGLKKLDTQVDTGISYRDYSGALAEAKLPVRLFAEGPEAAANPEFVKSLLKSIEHYEFAKRVWDAKFSALDHEKMLGGGFISAKGTLGQTIKERYPAAQLLDGYYPLPTLLPFAWAEAEKEADAAAAIAPSGGGATSQADALRSENEAMKRDLEMQALRKENAELKRRIADEGKSGD